jgi:hypothetical protein
MKARSDVKHAADDAAVKEARGKVQEAKVQLGERGPVWWDDGASDVNRHHPKNTSYADWWRALDVE